MRSTNPDTVKFKTEFAGIPIHVDRPKGFTMSGKDSKGVAWTRTYKFDYGFIPKTQGGDGDGLDVFLGPSKDSTDTFWALQHKPDGSFDEWKLFLGFDTKAAAEAAYKAHIPPKMLKKMITMKLDLVKVLVGVSPSGITKAASFFDELGEIYASAGSSTVFGHPK